MFLTSWKTLGQLHDPFAPQDTSMNGIGKACDNMSQMKELYINKMKSPTMYSPVSFPLPGIPYLLK